jgi:hypothetical protein
MDRVLSSQLDIVDIVEPNLTTDGYMWTRYFGFCGSRLYLETIKEDPLVHYHMQNVI